MVMFSTALRSWSDVIACGITPIDWRTSFAWRTISNPFTRAVPELGGTSVVNMRIRVDLPAPFGPSSPNATVLDGKVQRILTTKIAEGSGQVLDFDVSHYFQ